MKQATEEILIQALKLRDEGQEPERILAAFPEAAQDLREYFSLASLLQEEAQKILPSPQLLRDALRRAEAVRGNVSRNQVQFAVAGFFERLPLALKVLAPAFAVLVLVALADLSRVNAPVLAPSVPGTENPTEDAFSLKINNDSSHLNSSQDASRGIDPAPLLLQSAATPMMAAPAAAPAPAAFQKQQSGPALAADQLAQSYIENADAEEVSLSHTSTTEAAASSSDPSHSQ